LKIAQPALSQQIQKLETSLYTRLLDRDRHCVALTAVGQVFLREARTILAQVQHARNEVDRVKAGGQGTLRVAYLAGPARGELTATLHRLRQTSPAVRVELHEATTTDILRDVIDGKFDAAMTPEFDPPHPRGIEHDLVATQEVVLAVGSGHALAGRKSVKLSDLRTADFVAYDESVAPGYRRWINEVCREAGFRPRIAQRVSAANDLLVALSSLPGVAILPEGYRDLFAGGVELLAIKPRPEPMELWMWWRKGDDSTAMTAFRNAAVATDAG
jgi:DNA-binding transcriptional LysR family regulator